MNWPGEWSGCLELAARLGIEVTVVLVLTVALIRRTKSPLWSRALWQAAFIGVLSLLLLELADVPAAVRTRFGERKSAQMGGAAGLAAEKPVTELPGLPAEFRTQVLSKLHQNRLLALKAQAGGEPEPFLEERVLPWPAIVWVFGTAATLGVLAAARLFFFGLRCCWRELESPEIQSRTALLAEKLGLRRRVKLLEAEPLKAPAAVGVIGGVIAVPAGFAGSYTVAQQEAMLAHELAHLAAADPLWQVIADLAASLLWWHPLVWWARRRFRGACEAAADEGSLVLSNGPQELAQCLLALASRTGREPARPGLSVTGFRSGLGRRIERLLELKGHWSPPRGWRVCVLKTLFPMALLAVVTVCSAWVGPQNKGASMHSIGSTWRRSVATLALLGAFGAEHGHMQMASATAQTDPARSSVTPTPAVEAHDTAAPVADVDRSKLLEDARILIETDKLDEAEAKLQLVLLNHPDNKRALRMMDQIRTLRGPGKAEQPSAPAGGAPTFRMDPRMAARYGLRPAAVAAPAADTSGTDTNSIIDRYHMDPRLAARYGLIAGTTPAPAATTGHAKADVESKLNQIIINEVQYDSLPLAEVVRDLNDQARRRDPDKKGINFLISNVPAEPIPTGIDPTTGQPLPAPAFDLAPVLIRLHLRDVRLKDVLDAMTKVGDRPLRYSVEDYGVIFYPGLGPQINLSSTRAGAPQESPRLQVRTFHVDKENFLPGLESAFGISLHHDKASVDSATEEKLARIDLQSAKEKYQRLNQVNSQQHIVSQADLSDTKAAVDRAEVRLQAAQEKAGGQSSGTNVREIQQALPDLLRQLGIHMDVPNKAVFYNDLTGIVMVRATADDLELVQAAIETLGGKMLKPTPVLGDIPPAKAAAATHNGEK